MEKKDKSGIKEKKKKENSEISASEKTQYIYTT